MALSEYHYRRRVQFQETDASGIVHFTNFFKYAEEAEHAMWREAGLTIESSTSEIGWPRVAASFEYLKALYFQDEIDVHLRIIAKSGKTIQYRSVLTRNGIVVAVGTSTCICVRKRPGEPLKAMDIPPDIDARFGVAPAEDA